MSFNLLDIWNHMGFLNRLISITLLVMGVACLTIFFERLYSLARNRKQSLALAAQVGPLAESGQFNQALDLARQAGDAGGYFAHLLVAALGAALAQTRGGELNPLERAERETERWRENFGRQLRRGMSTLASTGSVAPFIGLLGTVVGIIMAFKTISLTGSGGISSVAGGISEALVETALGLLIAIPATLMFNLLTGKIGAFEAGAVQNAGRILELLEDYGYGHDRQPAKQ